MSTPNHLRQRAISICAALISFVSISAQPVPDLDLSWENLQNVFINDDKVEKDGTHTSWDAWCTSVNQLPAQTNGSFSFTLRNTNGEKAIGITTSLSNGNYASYPHCFYFQDDNVFIIEQGNVIGNFGTISGTPVYTIEREADNVKYYEDGILLYTSTRSNISNDMLIEISIFTPSTGFENLSADFGGNPIGITSIAESGISLMVTGAGLSGSIATGSTETIFPVASEPGKSQMVTLSILNGAVDTGLDLEFAIDRYSNIDNLRVILDDGFKRRSMLLPSEYGGFDQGNLSLFGKFFSSFAGQEGLATYLTNLGDDCLEEAQNFHLTKVYNGNNQPFSITKEFFDGLGRPTQIQSADRFYDQVLVAETIYDAAGRTGMQTQVAPSYEDNLCYKVRFTVNEDGNTYSYKDFDQKNVPNPTRNNPKGLETSVNPNDKGKLHWYWHNQQNTEEAFVDFDSHPFAINDYVDDPLNMILTSGGIGTEHQPGSGNEATIVHLRHGGELAYVFGRANTHVEGVSGPIQCVKSITRPADGLDYVNYTDAAGRTIATCISGLSTSQCGQTFVKQLTRPTYQANDGVTIPNYKYYTDLHVPASGKSSVEVSLYYGPGWNLNNNSYSLNNTYTFFDIEKQAFLDPADYSINMVTGEVTFLNDYATGAHFFRVYFEWPQTYIEEMSTPSGELDSSVDLPFQYVTGTLDYDVWELYSYDRNGNLIRTVAPEGIDCITYDPTLEYSEIFSQKLEALCSDCNTSPTPSTGTYITGDDVWVYPMSALNSSLEGRAINLSIQAFGNAPGSQPVYCDAYNDVFYEDIAQSGPNSLPYTGNDISLPPITRAKRSVSAAATPTEAMELFANEVNAMDQDYALTNLFDPLPGAPQPPPVNGCDPLECDDCIDADWVDQYKTGNSQLLRNRAKAMCNDLGKNVAYTKRIVRQAFPDYYCTVCEDRVNNDDDYRFLARFKLDFEFYTSQNGGLTEIHPDGGGSQSIYMEARINPAGCKVRWMLDDEEEAKFQGFFSQANFPNATTPIDFIVKLADVKVGRYSHYYYYDFIANNVRDELLRFVNLNMKIVHSTFSAFYDTSPPHIMDSEYTYEPFGELVKAEETDRRTTRFSQNDLGQTRFSQTNAQYQDGLEFSYMVYDKIGRITEAGDYTPATSGANNIQFQTVYGSTTSPSLGAGATSTLTLVNEQDGLPTANKSEVITLLYDIADPSPSYPSPSSWIQRNVDGNLSKSESDAQTTWYSYNEYGQLEWMIVRLHGISGSAGYKTIEYTYDMLGLAQVSKIAYQAGNPSEAYYWNYTFDDQERLHQVHTGTTDSKATAFLQALYEYYDHGPLERIELGDKTQGLDFVYTVHGMLKAVNPGNQASFDPGVDGGEEGAHTDFAEDVFGFSLDYFQQDYERYTSAVFSFHNSTGSPDDQYMGSVKQQRWWHRASLTSGGSDYEDIFGYHYNERHWLEEASWGNFPSEQPVANPFTTDDYRVHGITYDRNGNIETLKRNAYGTNLYMDDFSYHYEDEIYNDGGTMVSTGQKTRNRLLHFNDGGAHSANWSMDLDDPGAINTAPAQQYFEYDASGRTTRMGIGSNARLMEYNAVGLMTKFKDHNGFDLVENHYNESGMRVFKKTYQPGSSGLTTTLEEHYVYGAGGMLLAVYRDEQGGSGLLPATYPIAGIGTYAKGSNEVYYELTDHLGSVRSVIKRAKDGNGNAQIISYQDYYPFGAVMPGKSFHAGDEYRFGFQGQQTDAETGFTAFNLRQHNAWLGRWSTPDPMRQYWNSYLSMGNDPASRTDPTGGSDDLNTDKAGYQYSETSQSWFYITGGGDAYRQLPSQVPSGIRESYEFINGNSQGPIYVTDPDEYYDSQEGLGPVRDYDVGDGLEGQNVDRLKKLHSSILGMSEKQYYERNSSIDYSNVSLLLTTAVAGGLLEELALLMARSALTSMVLTAPLTLTGDVEQDKIVTLYRGVAPNHPGYPLALTGSVVPGGVVWDPVAHNEGSSINSIFTSWTFAKGVAIYHANKAGGGGVILSKSFRLSELVPSQDMFRELEVLIPGPIKGAYVEKAIGRGTPNAY